MVNTELLNEKIESSGKRIKYLAKKIGVGSPAFISKRNGRSRFTVQEALILCDELDVKSIAEMHKLFMSKG